MNASVRTPRRLVALLLVALIGAASCGIPFDSQPRAVETDESPSAAQPGTPAGGGTEVALYYISNELLTVVLRNAADGEPLTVLTELAAQSGVTPASGTVSQIPKGTAIRSATLDGSTLVVDLTEAFDNVVGVGRQQAVAQMVMTATELRGVTSLRFAVNGIPTTVTSPVRGDQSNVTACDYLPLMPSDDALSASRTDLAVARRLSIRRRLLENSCPTAG